MALDATRWTTTRATPTKNAPFGGFDAAPAPVTSAEPFPAVQLSAALLVLGGGLFLLWQGISKGPAANR
jgi:hypothetical protein